MWKYKQQYWEHFTYVVQICARWAICWSIRGDAFLILRGGEGGYFYIDFVQISVRFVFQIFQISVPNLYEILPTFVCHHHLKIFQFFVGRSLSWIVFLSSSANRLKRLSLRKIFLLTQASVAAYWTWELESFECRDVLNFRGSKKAQGNITATDATAKSIRHFDKY